MIYDDDGYSDLITWWDRLEIAISKLLIVVGIALLILCGFGPR